jgi:hypothetical protein
MPEQMGFPLVALLALRTLEHGIEIIDDNGQRVQVYFADERGLGCM